jgi:cell division septation protein DedD
VRRHDITARDASIAAQVQELQNEVAASAAPGNLAQAAAALGMVPAMNPAFLVVASDGAVRVLGSPAAVSPVVVAQQPRQHATSTRTPTKSASPTSSKSSTDHPTHGHASTSSSPTPTPAPTPTPTPTLTLPGGNR